MLVFDNSYDLVQHICNHDLEENGVTWNISEDNVVSGYLYHRETSSFPVGDRFKLNVKFESRDEAEKCIYDIKFEIYGV